jgi:NAD(P)H-hydrate epimerase
VRALDHEAIEVQGLPGYDLMNRAAAAVFAAIRSYWPGESRLNVICGAGNNAGDGYVLARIAQAAGYEVWVAGLKAADQLGGDAATAVNDYISASGIIAEFTADSPQSPGIVVDALLGTGLDRPVSGTYADAIRWINAQPGPVVAVDIPSGLSADTGSVMGVAVKADLTVSFIGQKQGLFTASGPEQAGICVFDDLEVPRQIYEAVSKSGVIIREKENWFSARKRDTHKGSFGHVFALGGAPGYAGAVRMCGEAALRSGAGLVSLATHVDHAAIINATRPELMVRAVADGSDFDQFIEAASVIAAGPGLGQGDWGKNLFKAALATATPLVVDADALNLLADEPQSRGNWIITPHPGEAARLLGSSVAEVQGDRFSAVRELAARFNAVAILKGCGSLVCGPDGELALCDAGNPGMASAGMGDVLTGVIAACAAQGMNLFEAACAGVWVHAVAGDRAARLQGERGLFATDLLPHLQSIVNRK